MRFDLAPFKTCSSKSSCVLQVQIRPHFKQQVHQSDCNAFPDLSSIQVSLSSGWIQSSLSFKFEFLVRWLGCTDDVESFFKLPSSIWLSKRIQHKPWIKWHIQIFSCIINQISQDITRHPLMCLFDNAISIAEKSETRVPYCFTVHHYDSFSLNALGLFILYHILNWTCWSVYCKAVQDKAARQRKRLTVLTVI